MAKGVNQRNEDIDGQGGVKVPVREIDYATDEFVLDPNSDLAVQIPEGSGADMSRHTNPYADALGSGHVEAKFGTEAAPGPTGSEAVEVDHGGEHKADHERVESAKVHNKPASQRKKA